MESYYFLDDGMPYYTYPPTHLSFKMILQDAYSQSHFIDEMTR